MRHLSPALFLSLLSVTASADDATELQNLHAALDMLNQQQQAIYQQFQMVQELRRSGSPCGSPLYPQVVGYEEAVAAQKSAVQRDESLFRQAGELLARHGEIEDRKKPLQARIYELSRER